MSFRTEIIIKQMEGHENPVVCLNFQIHNIDLELIEERIIIIIPVPCNLLQIK